MSSRSVEGALLLSVKLVVHMMTAALERVNIIILIIIIFIYCNWVVTRWQCLFHMYAKHGIGYYMRLDTKTEGRTDRQS